MEQLPNTLQHSQKPHIEVIQKAKARAFSRPSPSLALHRRVEWQTEKGSRPPPQREGTHSSVLILKQQPPPLLPLLFTPRSLPPSLDNTPSPSLLHDCFALHAFPFFSPPACVSPVSFTSCSSPHFILSLHPCWLVFRAISSLHQSFPGASLDFC